MSSKNKKLNIDKNVLYDLYVNQQLSSTEIGKIFDCSHRTILNYLKRYDIKARSFSEANIIFANNRTEEDLKKRANKFRETWYSHSEEERERINKTRAIKSENVEEAVNKARVTKRKNGTCKRSKSEDAFYESLKITFNDVERWYSSDPRYPFECDFYIPSKDLFIEYQGHPSHGNEPFDPNNQKHLEFLDNTKLDMTTWTTRDPKKLKVAKENNINLVLIYPRHTNYILKNKELTALKINELWEI